MIHHILMKSKPSNSLLQAIDSIDRRCMDRVHAPKGRLRLLVLAITSLGSAVVTLPVEFLVWLLASPPISAIAGLCLLADVPGHMVLIVPLRYLVRRPRPTPFARPPLGFDVWNLYSFPSAHSLRMWTLATIVTVTLPQAWLLAILGALTVTATRIVLRRHFPSDILVGALLGVVWGRLLVWLVPSGIPGPW